MNDCYRRQDPMSVLADREMPERQLPSILKDQYVVDTSPWAARIRAEFGALVVCNLFRNDWSRSAVAYTKCRIHHDVRYSGVWIALSWRHRFGRPTQPAVSGPGAIATSDDRNTRRSLPQQSSEGPLRRMLPTPVAPNRCECYSPWRKVVWAA